MATDFDIVEQRRDSTPNTKLVKVQFRPIVDEPFHSNIFHMQLYPTGRRLIRDGQGRLVTEGGTLIVPDDFGNFPAENPVDPYQRETFTRNNDAEMVNNIEAYWERKLQAAAAGRPYPQHHKSTLNLQVGLGTDDAQEIKATGAVALTLAEGRFGTSGFEEIHMGLRFTGVSGLSGQVINSAVFTFRSSRNESGNFIGDWFAHDAEAPGTFTTTNSNISDTAQRPRTTTTCEGDGDDFGTWTSGDDETFSGPAPGIQGIIQELADSHDPSAIVLLHIGDTGSGQRRAFENFEEDSSLAAKLDIDFGAAAPVTELPRSVPANMGPQVVAVPTQVSGY